MWEKVCEAALCCLQNVLFLFTKYHDVPTEDEMGELIADGSGTVVNVATPTELYDRPFVGSPTFKEPRKEDSEGSRWRSLFRQAHTAGTTTLIPAVELLQRRLEALEDGLPMGIYSFLDMWRIDDIGEGGEAPFAKGRLEETSHLRTPIGVIVCGAPSCRQVAVSTTLNACEELLLEVAEEELGARLGTLVIRDVGLEGWRRNMGKRWGPAGFRGLSTFSALKITSPGVAKVPYEMPSSTQRRVRSQEEQLDSAGGKKPLLSSYRGGNKDDVDVCSEDEEEALEAQRNRQIANFVMNILSAPFLTKLVLVGCSFAPRDLLRLEWPRCARRGGGGLQLLVLACCGLSDAHASALSRLATQGTFAALRFLGLSGGVSVAAVRSLTRALVAHGERADEILPIERQTPTNLLEVAVAAPLVEPLRAASLIGVLVSVFVTEDVQQCIYTLSKK